MATFSLPSPSSLLSPSCSHGPFLHPTHKTLHFRSSQPKTYKGLLAGKASMIDESSTVDPPSSSEEIDPMLVASLKLKLLPKGKKGCCLRQPWISITQPQQPAFFPSKLHSTKEVLCHLQYHHASPTKLKSTQFLSSTDQHSRNPGFIFFKNKSAVSGLNRGLAADELDMKSADSAAKELETVGRNVDLTKDLDRLQGRWKLIYSSGFSSRTLGGSRPGPPIGRLLPITVGQVFQRIDTVSKDFDNIVELQFGTPWPLPPVEATATLAHKFELIGTSSIKINFKKTTVRPTGNLSQLPPLEVPRLPDNLRPPSNTGSGEFEVTYLDADTRITRGDRGELRVFVIA